MTERWWIAEGRREAIEERAGLDLAAWMQPSKGARVLSSDRQSAAVHLPGPAPLLVKWRVPIPGRRRRAFLRPSRERREALAMLRLRALGIDAPAPWAVAERRTAGLLRGSLFIRSFDPEAETADRLEDAWALATVASALRSWHDVGFRHGDCYPKNILVGGAVKGPRPIGCPSARWRPPGPHPDRWRLKDLAQFQVGCPDGFQEAGFDALLEAYAATPGLPPGLGALIQPFVARIYERKAQRIATRPQREPDGPPQPQPLTVADAPRVRVLPLSRS